MIQLTPEQMSVLSRIPREVFVGKMLAHLKEVAHAAGIDYGLNNASQDILNRLRRQTDSLIDNGFEYEFDIASIIECFEIFAVDSSSAGVRGIIEDKTLTERQKLDFLCELRDKRGES